MVRMLTQQGGELFGLMLLSCVLVQLLGGERVSAQEDAAASAAPFAGEEARITDQTAYTLRDGELKVGLWAVEYGLFERVDVGTFVLPWFFQTFSLSGKYEWFRGEDWSIANTLTLVRFDLQDLNKDSDPVVFAVVPFEMAASYRFDEDLSLSVEGVFTNISVQGSFDGDDIRGAAAVSNAQLAATLLWRWTETWSVLVHGRSLVYQDIEAAANVSYDIDPYTYVEVSGGASSDVVDIEGASSIVISLHWALEVFNLRFGLGYGNWSVPMVNFVMPNKTPILDLDLFWRW